MPQEVPSTIHIENLEISFTALHNAFATGELGSRLSGNTRFIGHKPEGVESYDWEKILGGDANNLHHLIITKRLAELFLNECLRQSNNEKEAISEEADFTPEEQKLLLLTATVHDWAEAVTGDINYYQKTKNDHQREMDELQKILTI